MSLQYALFRCLLGRIVSDFFDLYRHATMNNIRNESSEIVKQNFLQSSITFGGK